MDLDTRRPRRSARRLGLLILLPAAACGAEPELSFSPPTMSWGEVDFGGRMPADGFAPQTLSITNEGDATVEMTLVDFPFDYLCLKGFSATPAELPTLETTQVTTLDMAVCGYDPEGGLGVARSGDIVMEASGSTVKVPWSFTPVVSQGGNDTGR